jgi:hypothetical protein
MAMPMENQNAARRLLFEHPEGISDVQLADLIHTSRQNAAWIRRRLGAKQVRYGRWTLTPAESDAQFARLVLWRLQEEEWAEGEREADKDLATGNYQAFLTMEALFDDLFPPEENEMADERELYLKIYFANLTIFEYKMANVSELEDVVKTICNPGTGLVTFKYDGSQRIGSVRHSEILYMTTVIRTE